MKLVTFILLIASFAILACSDLGSPSDLSATYPTWINQLITQFQNAPVGNPPQSIWQYQFHGHRVYYVPAQCCDQFSTLYDSLSHILCAPDGGWSGRGDGHCPDFFQERTGEVLIWRDSRTR